ncbi:hypothetical protein [Kiloniella sp.]|uniref:hypothetical protein n=1 Tax=Kiloniella sp. TaxID=1938587 RepID=UPI003B017255
MQNVTDGDDFTLRFDFVELGEFISPDLNSVTYTVRDNNGVVIATQNNIAVSTSEDTTEVTITIPGSVNSNTLNREYRFVILKYTYQGNSKVLTQQYRVTPWLNIGTSTERVRARLGVTSSELPDQDIDLYEAYFTLDEKLGDTVLNTALTSGNINADNANNTLEVVAALKAFPSLQLRIAQVDKADTHEFRRLSKIDFQQLHQTLIEKYSELVNKLSGSTETQFNLFSVVTPTDAITGS